MPAREPVRISPYNAAAGERPFAKYVRLCDITLREGQQAPSVAYDAAQRVELGRRLDSAGVTEIQCGFVGRDEPTVAALKAAGVKARLTLMLIGFGEAWRDAVLAAAAAGVDVIEVLVRSGEPQLQSMGISHPDSIRQVEATVGWAAKNAPETWFCPSFSSLSQEDHLRRMLSVAQSAGAVRFNMPDSSGVARPSGMRRLVEVALLATAGAPVGVHCHNDFGLAVANTIAGLEAGASAADVSVNGYGERAGNCPLEELVIALELLYGVRTGVAMEKLTELSRWAADATRLPLAHSKPVSGQDVFAQKLDIHVRLTERDGTLLEPYPPKLVGNQRVIRLGLGTGPAAVRKKLTQLGLTEPDDEGVGLLVEAVNTLAEQQKQVSDADLIELARKLQLSRAPM
jgi:isopropylmalate/homocitrate/citramalate synthase